MDTKQRALLLAVFESEALMEFPTPTSTVAAIETCSEMANFAKKHENIEKSPIFSQKLFKTVPVQLFSLPTNLPTPTKLPSVVTTPFIIQKLPKILILLTQPVLILTIIKMKLEVDFL